MRLEKSTIGEFAQVVSDYLDKPIIVSADFNKPFSINASFDNKDQLKELFKSSIISSGLEYQENDLTITVSSVNSFRPQSSESQFSKLLPAAISSQPSSISDGFKSSPVPILLRELKTYKIKNVSSTEVFNSLTKFYQNSSQVTILDSINNNSLAVYAIKAEHKNVAKLISVFDSSVKQVLIEAVITELSDKDYQGLDKTLENYSRLNNAVSNAAYYAVNNPLSSFAEFGMKLLTSKSLRFFLDWVKTSDTSSVLSKPKLVTLDRKPASIVVGQNVPFITGRVTNQASPTTTPFQTIERQDIGLRLQVTPTVLPNGLVELSILQESSSVSNDTLASDIVTNKRSITSTALVANGETLLLGGLSSFDTSKGKTQTVPDSLFDWFFSGNKQTQTNTNLVVLISVTLVSNSLSKDGDFNQRYDIDDDDFEAGETDRRRSQRGG